MSKFAGAIENFGQGVSGVGTFLNQGEKDVQKGLGGWINNVLEKATTGIGIQHKLPPWLMIVGFIAGIWMLKEIFKR